MNFWHQAPFARLLLPFISGIACSMFFPLPAPVLVILLLATLATYLFLLWYFKRSLLRKIQLLQGCCIIFITLLSGYLLHHYHREASSPLHFAAQKADWLLLQLEDDPAEKPGSIKVLGSVQACLHGEKKTAVRGKLLLYLAKDSSSRSLKYGDVLLIRNKSHEVEEPGNPEEFNYKRYLQFNNIFHKAYLKKGDYQVLAHEQGNPLFAYAFKLREHLLQVFRTYIEGRDERAVAEALVFGYMDELDPDLVQSYSNTGTLHVLAVSGMHVGIIFMVLNWLLAFMDKHRSSSLFKAVFIMLLLWAYSILAGLSPSILRASTMFSFIIVGRILQRHSSIYNTLAASAFLLIVINPDIIASVGFQLSYAAVTGIVFLQPKILAWYQSRYWLLQKMWELTAISIAAQITTFPVGLLYFHQFPNYFIFSNLLIIPLTTLVLHIAILLICFSWQSTLATWLGKLIMYGLALNNKLVAAIDHLPFATWNGISISIPETLLIYLFIFSLSAFLLYKKSSWLYTSLCCGILLSSWNLYEQQTQFTRKKLLVYKVRKHSAIAFVDGKNCRLLADSALLCNASSIRFHLLHHWWSLGLDELPQADTLYESRKEGALLHFAGKKILLLDKKSKISSFAAAGQAELIILRNNPWVDWEALKQCPVKPLLLIDACNHPRKVQYWKKMAGTLHIPVYDIEQEGAFEMDLI